MCIELFFRNEDAFFKRQGLPQSSESLFVTPAESPISASNEPINRKEILQNPKFDLNGSSFLSGKADSSLGILNVENFSGNLLFYLLPVNFNN